jgi:hypothetical protein
MPEIDVTVAHIARVYDFWLGGKDNFTADRTAALEVMETFPEIVASVRAIRGFLVRMVHYLVAEAGIRQFLDIGTGLPTANNTHEVAQRVAPDSRVVYVDNDPIVLSHAAALLTSMPQGVTAYIDADLRDVPRILSQAERTLDFTRPVAVLLLGVLPMIPDSDDPYGIVARLMRAVPAASYLAISHVASDLQTRPVATAAGQLNQSLAEKFVLRSREDVAEFFAGLELVDPGITQVNLWRPGTRGLGLAQSVPFHCGLGRKPAAVS